MTQGLPQHPFSEGLQVTRQCLSSGGSKAPGTGQALFGARVSHFPQSVSLINAFVQSVGVTNLPDAGALEPSHHPELHIPCKSWVPRLQTPPRALPLVPAQAQDPKSAFAIPRAMKQSQLFPHNHSRETAAGKEPFPPRFP